MFDFGVGYSEMFVLAVVAVIVIGPKDLPKVLRSFGQMMNKMRGMAREFQGHVDQAMKEAGVDGLKKDVTEMKNSIDASAKKTMTEGIVKPQGAVNFSSGYGVSNAAKDFENYFGVDSVAGETRVAGAVVEVPASS